MVVKTRKIKKGDAPYQVEKAGPDFWVLVDTRNKTPEKKIIDFGNEREYLVATRNRMNTNFVLNALGV